MTTRAEQAFRLFRSEVHFMIFLSNCIDRVLQHRVLFLFISFGILKGVFFYSHLVPPSCSFSSKPYLLLRPGSLPTIQVQVGHFWRNERLAGQKSTSTEPGPYVIFSLNFSFCFPLLREDRGPSSPSTGFFALRLRSSGTRNHDAWVREMGFFALYLALACC